MCVAFILSYCITKYNVTVTHGAASRFLIAKRLFFFSASANSDRGMLRVTNISEAAPINITRTALWNQHNAVKTF